MRGEQATDFVGAERSEGMDEADRGMELSIAFSTPGMPTSTTPISLRSKRSRTCSRLKIRSRSASSTTMTRMGASAGYDGKIRLWPKEGAGEPVVLWHGGNVFSLVALADGRLASGGKIRLWLVDEQKLIAALCLRAGRNLTKAEWARYIGTDTPTQPSCRDRPSNWRTPD
jgi:hypothetical protein